MASFKFQLQSLLNLKEQLEKSVQNELGIANRKLEQEKSKLCSIDKDIELYTNNFKQACKGSIHPEKIKELKTYLNHLYKRKQAQMLSVKRAQQNVDKIREKLIGIMREKKVLDNLKENKFKEFKKLEEKSEQQRVDELVSYKDTKKEHG